MGVKGVETVANKRHLSYNIVNTIKGENSKALKKPNKNRNIIIIFLRIGIIGLKDWLYWVGVLINSLKCKYG